MGSLVYSRECGEATAVCEFLSSRASRKNFKMWFQALEFVGLGAAAKYIFCLLYTSDAADE